MILTKLVFWLQFLQIHLFRLSIIQSIKILVEFRIPRVYIMESGIPLHMTLYKFCANQIKNSTGIWNSSTLLNTLPLTRVGALSGHKPHISDLQTLLLAKLTSESHTSSSEPHKIAPVSCVFFFDAFHCLRNEKLSKIYLQLYPVQFIEYIIALL